MKATACWLLLVLAGCAVDGAIGADAYDDTACRKLGATASEVTFTDTQATAVVDMLDHATAAELDAVPSVSAAIAKAIVAARPFGSAAHPLAKLDALTGVGPKALTALRDNVTTLWCAIADGRQSCCGGGGPSTPSIVINEFAPGSSGWVELYNAGPTAVDLTGWAVDDVRPGGAKAVTLASGTVAQPHGFVTVKFGGINSGSSDQVTLVNPKGQVVDQTASVYAGASLSGKCFARSTDGGAWATAPVSCTPGASNGGAGCAAPGGTYDGATFTVAEECHALDFLNQARFSEMAAIPDVQRHLAYDCTLSPTSADPHAISCGYRSGLWAGLAQYSGVSGVAATALGAVKSAAATWQKNGLSYDTVANTFLTRAALVDKNVSLDAVYVTKQLPDETGTTPYSCVEVRDAPDGKNFLAACRNINADMSTPCAGGKCTQDMVGKWLHLRGTVRHSSFQGSGYKINLVAQLPDAADPRVLSGAAALDCPAIVEAAGVECGGLGYSKSECLTAYLTSHDADTCTAELQGQMFDDT
jgi:hypothetical protein